MLGMCSDPRVKVLPARDFRASRFFSASFSRLASASHAPLVIPVRHAVWFMADVSRVSTEIPKSLSETFRLSLYRRIGLYHFFSGLRQSVSPGQFTIEFCFGSLSNIRINCFAHLSWACCKRAWILGIDARLKNFECRIL